MIKGLCVESGDKDAKLMFDGSTPVLGKYYYLEDITAGSGNQNRLFHALLTVFWNYMFNTNTFEIQDGEVMYDLSCDSVENFKDLLKSKYGKGFSHINYVNENYQIIRVDSLEYCPLEVLEDFGSGNRKRIKGVLVSWADYSMPQRHKLITTVFNLMDIFGVDSNKYSDIKQGLIDIENERLRQDREVREKKKNGKS